MKLLTHNMLACHIKGVKENQPFIIEATETREVDADYNPDFLRHIYPRIEWPTLRTAAATLARHAVMETRATFGSKTMSTPPIMEFAPFLCAASGLDADAGDLPEEVQPEMLEDDEFLRRFHHALLEVQLVEGALICPETGRRFKVSKGIPNLLLNEDEC